MGDEPIIRIGDTWQQLGRGRELRVEGVSSQDRYDHHRARWVCVTLVAYRFVKPLKGGTGAPTRTMWTRSEDFMSRFRPVRRARKEALIK